jgi:hypothetical protein
MPTTRSMPETLQRTGIAECHWRCQCCNGMNIYAGGADSSVIGVPTGTRGILGHGEFTEGGSDSSAIGVLTGTRGVLGNGGIAANSQPSSKGLLQLHCPDSRANGAARRKFPVYYRYDGNAGGTDSSAIGVPTGTRGVLRNGGIAANAQRSSKDLLRLNCPDSGAIAATRGWSFGARCGHDESGGRSPDPFMPGRCQQTNPHARRIGRRHGWDIVRRFLF